MSNYYCIFIVNFQMKNLTAERVKTVGDLPSPRFGHTFTMVSSSKAVLFGGAVSLASTSIFIQINLSLPTKLSYSTSSHRSGPNLTLSTILCHQKGQPTRLWWSLKCRWSSMEELPQATKASWKMSSIFLTSEKSTSLLMQPHLENNWCLQQTKHSRTKIRPYYAF